MFFSWEMAISDTVSRNPEILMFVRTARHFLTLRNI